MQELKDGYEDQINQLQEKNDLLKWNIEESQGINVKRVENITSLEQKLKYLYFVSVGSSFSKFKEKEFK